MGLRESNRERTRATIQTVALSLIAERGYETTTCEQIAAAAGVSPATFYRYFPTKEDVVLSDDYDELLVGLLHDRPRRERPIRAVRRSLAAGLDAVYADDAGVIRERLRLIMAVPALRARRSAQIRATEELLIPEVAARLGRAPSSLEARAVTAAIVAAVVAAVEYWAADGGALPALIDHALGALEDQAARRR